MTGPFQPGQSFNVEIEFTCPFCGGQAAVVKPYAVMHVEPRCATFERLDPHEYLQAVNDETFRRRN